MSESPEDLVKRLGYSPEQARAMHAWFAEAAKVRHEISLQMFALAKKYVESAYVVRKHMDSTRNADFAPGQIMCLSLALELFFKCLVVLEHKDVYQYVHLPAAMRKKLETHHIPTIFDLIEDKHK